MLNTYDIFMQELKTLKSEAEIKKFFAQNSGVNDQSVAQYMHSHFFKKISIAENYHANRQEIEKSGKIYSEADTVSFTQNEINRFSKDEFSKLSSSYDIKKIFNSEIKRQKELKQAELKANTPNLYHFSTVDLRKINGGEVLRAMTSRPDMAQEEMFLGVCAFPSDIGTYTLKNEKNKNGKFVKEDYVILYEAPPENEKETIGYGYKIDSTRFTPTVSNSGAYLEEWTARGKDVEKNGVAYSEVIEVNMKYLRQKGLQIFYANEDSRAFIENVTNNKELTTEMTIAKLKEIAKEGVIVDYNQMMIDKEAKNNSLSNRISTLKSRLGINSILKDTSAQQNKNKVIDYSKLTYKGR